MQAQANKRSRSTRPRFSDSTRPSYLHDHCCPHCKQIFQSVYSLPETAIANHRGRNKSCLPTIQKSAPFEQLALDDIQAMNFTDDDHECLTEYIDWTRSRLNPDMNYSAVELNDAVHAMLVQEEEAGEGGPIEGDINIAAISRSKPSSKDFLEFQAVAEIKYNLPENDSSIFNLRNRVKWQDVLSLQVFGLQANLSEAMGDSLLDLIGEIIERHHLPAIPLHQSWKRLSVSIGRKLVPSASVRGNTASVVYIMASQFLILLKFNT